MIKNKDVTIAIQKSLEHVPCLFFRIFVTGLFFIWGCNQNWSVCA